MIDLKKTLNVTTFLALSLPLSAAELFPAGDFEKESFKPLGVNRLQIVNGKIQRSGAGNVKLQSDKVFSGKKALLVEAEKNVRTALNLYGLNLTPGQQYTVSWRYFIAESNPEFKTSARISLPLPNKQYKNHYPMGSNTPGKWHHFKYSFFPTAGAKKLNLTVWIGPGPCKVYLDDLKVTEFEPVKAASSDANTACLKHADGVTIWKQSNYRRVDSTGIPAGIKSNAHIELTAAANEMEPFQLVVSPEKDLKDVSLEISSFKGPGGTIPATAHSYGIVRYVPMRNPNNPTLKGDIGDPIVPEKSTLAPAGKNTVFFVRIYAPAGTRPGKYSGLVTVKSSSGVLGSFPVTLTVRNFTLPVTPHLRTLIYAHPTTTTRRYRDARGGAAVTQDLLQIMKEHRISSSRIPLPVPQYIIEGDTLKVTDWSSFDKILKERYDMGQRDFCVPGIGMMGGSSGWNSYGPKVFGESIFTPKGRKLAGTYARQFHEHWVKTAPADARYYCYVYDEPPAKVYKKLNEFTTGIMKEAPGFRLFMPHAIDPDLKNVTVHCIPFSFGWIKPELEKGRENFYYNWPQPLAHSAYIKNRLFAWQIFANGGQGGLKWDTTHTPGPQVNPWNELEKCYGNGEATTIYPAYKKKGNLVPSLRLAQMREAVDDVDYLTILRNKVDKHFPGMGQTYLLGEIKDLIPSLPLGYTNDQELLYNVRNRIGDAIENFDKAPVVLVTARPAKYSVTELSGVEVRVHAPAGAIIEINNVKQGTSNGKLFTAKTELQKFGLNEIPVKITHNGKSKETLLKFTLKRDPNLEELESRVAKLEKSRLNAAPFKAFLKKASSGNYTAADREMCAKLVNESSKLLLKHQLATLPPAKNALVQAVNKQARWMFDNDLYERSAYYLELARQFADSKLNSKSKLSIVPVNMQGNFGYRISNGLIEFTLLELGGRIISFKVNGIECFDGKGLAKTFPLHIRAGKKYHQFAARQIPILGGYEDAGWWVLPESAVDWDIAVKELSPARIALEASMVMRNGMFKISRIMSIVPGKPDLKIDYTISNIHPAEFKSDDPTHYQFTWRGRLFPKIGENFAGDSIDVPTKLPLKAVTVDEKKPVFYEHRSVPLTSSRLGCFNQGKKAGFVWKFDSRITHGYLWFDSRPKSKIYTLEVCRSFFGNTPGIPGNKPFYIEPGQSESFSMTFTGITEK